MTTDEQSAIKAQSLIQELAETIGRVDQYRKMMKTILPYDMDEYSLLFQDQLEMIKFVGNACKIGAVNFNTVPKDVMLRIGNQLGHQQFEVAFEFLTLPSCNWRVECMYILWGPAPLHEQKFLINDRDHKEDAYSGVFHMSYKLPDLDAYEDEKERLQRSFAVFKAEYQNSYGKFSYWFIDENLPLAKPRVNLRDS